MVPRPASGAVKNAPFLSSDPEPTASTLARGSSRVTRKVQPGIQEKAKSFLANAASNLESVSKSSPVSPVATLRSRKRKLTDVDLTNELAASSSMLKKAKEPEATDGPRRRVASLGKAKKLAVVDEDEDVPPSLAKRFTPVEKKRAKKPTVLDEDEDEYAAGSSKKTKKDEEKRLRIFRKAAPRTFLEKLNRARTQRMIVIGRTRTDTEAFPSEEIDIVGSTGNIYKVTIGQTCSCTCPDSKKGNECKHKVYALHTVLRAPEKLQYQLALLSSELREIFANAPPIPTDVSSSGDTDGSRKPIDGECPICYMDFDEEHNELVWCKAACGNNIHKSCFDQWAASQGRQTVKCIYCRTPWQANPADLKTLTEDGYRNMEGYVNVGHRFGMTEARDTSSYHQPWVRRNMWAM